MPPREQKSAPQGRTPTFIRRFRRSPIQKPLPSPTQHPGGCKKGKGAPSPQNPPMMKMNPQVLQRRRNRELLHPSLLKMSALTKLGSSPDMFQTHLHQNVDERDVAILQY
ncbi:hypothetical protein M8J77_000572 [Diaphorina citri]|nr:hypothetical protein M8J77_000572 [Diaphorina citri]